MSERRSSEFPMGDSKVQIIPVYISKNFHRFAWPSLDHLSSNVGFWVSTFIDVSFKVKKSLSLTFCINFFKK